MSRRSLSDEQFEHIRAILGNVAGDVSKDNKTRSDSDFYEKFKSLDVNKVPVMTVIVRVNRLILNPKLEPEWKKNTAVNLLKKLTFQCY